jgi:hypothetical protein
MTFSVITAVAVGYGISSSSPWKIEFIVPPLKKAKNLP